LSRGKMIRRIDTLRYALLLVFGGLYLDADNQR
jgi:mannosyltransferase OCH1-like enzyme